MNSKVVIILALQCLALMYCWDDGKREPFTDHGQTFATRCAGCHQLPDPGHLPLGIWDTVILPRMYHFMQEAGQSVSPIEAAAIATYIRERAPDSLGFEAFRIDGAADFSPHFTELFLSPPSVSYVDIPSAGGVVVADINKSILLDCGEDLLPRAQLTVGRGVTAVVRRPDAHYLTVIGSFSPTDEPVGQLLRWSGGRLDTLADGLRRPTDLLVLPGAVTRMVVTEYGQWSGRLRLFTLGVDGQPTQARTIEERTGGIAVVGESDSTFLVLYGQGDEAIVRYTFRADEFRSETVLRFAPTYGSSSLKVIDWNGDELPDLLYTAGDNADYTPIVKPYHGVRVFTGQTRGSYRQELFLPLPGAYDAVVEDLDGDGLREVAAISFFPDFASPVALSAVIFDGRGERWRTDTLAAGGAGRWLRLAAGDYDQDGDIDLVAGSLAMQTVPEGPWLGKWVRNGLPFVLWENQLLRASDAQDGNGGPGTP